MERRARIRQNLTTDGTDDTDCTDGKGVGRANIVGLYGWAGIFGPRITDILDYTDNRPASNAPHLFQTTPKLTSPFILSQIICVNLR